MEPKTARGSWKAEFYFDDDDKRDEKKDERSDATSCGKVAVKDQGKLELMESEKFWMVPDFQTGSDAKGFSMSKTILGKQITKEIVMKVLAEGKSELIEGFVSQRTRRSFDSYLVLDAKKGNVGWEFPPREEKSKAPRRTKKEGGKKEENDAPARRSASKAGSEKVGTVTVKGKGEHDLLQNEDEWLVDGLSFGKTRKPLTIRREMCSVAITQEMVTQLLAKGKTELIKDFVSRKTGRKFEAYLVLDTNGGRVSYEFPERK